MTTQTTSQSVLERELQPREPSHPLSHAEECDRENMIEAELSERARDEAERASPRFTEWLLDEDGLGVAGIVSNLIRGTPETCDWAKHRAEQLRDDYVQMRCATADNSERDRIEQELFGEDA